MLGIGYLHGGDGADIITDNGTDVGAADKIHGDIIHGDDGDDTLAGENSERMAGFDWAIHKRESRAADYDMNVSIFTNQQINNLRDRFDLVEGLSGW